MHNALTGSLVYAICIFMSIEHTKDFAEALARLAHPASTASSSIRWCVDELEALDIGQVDESERQPWDYAYKNRVMEIINRYMKSK